MTDTTRTRHPYAAAHAIAVALRDRLDPHCRRIAIAGSLRRGRPTIGDIELVAVPRTYRGAPRTLLEKLDNSGPLRNHLHDYLDELVEQGAIQRHTDSAGRQAWGDRLRKFTVTTRRGLSHKIDLFMCEEESWGNTLTIRTGSADFSRWLVTPQTRGGAMPPGMHHQDNTLYRNGRPVPCREEADLFAALGLPVIPPQYRHDNLWHQRLSKP